MDSLDISGLIAQIKKEILDAEKKSEGERKIMALDQLELEIKFVVTKGGSGKAGLKFLACPVSADGELSYQKEAVQSIKLTFKALGVPKEGKRKGPKLKFKGLSPVFLKPVIMKKP
ncbi:MAG: trypco2 family protein [Elusimicrobiota bacterium]|jgi:hypothetical protein